MASGDDSAEIDPFDALMSIEPDEFSQLLEEAPGDAGGNGFNAKPRRGGIPVVSVAIDPFRFRSEFLVPRRPVILFDPSNGVATGHANLTPTKLREKYGDQIVPLDVTDRDERVMVRLRDFLDAVEEKDLLPEKAESNQLSDDATRARIETSKELPGTSLTPTQLRGKYLRNLHVRDFFPEEVVALPNVLQPNHLCDEKKVPACPKTWRQWFELFVSHPASPGFPFLHRDACCVHAASTQVCGTKRWVLFPPEAGEQGLLYATGPSGRRSSVAKEFIRTLFEPAIPVETLKEYPLLGAVKGRVVCDVHEGETLIVPANWWHCAIAVEVTENADEETGEGTHNGSERSRNSEKKKKQKKHVCVSVAASFVDESNLNAFNDAYCEFRAIQTLTGKGAGGIQ